MCGIFFYLLGQQTPTVHNCVDALAARGPEGKRLSTVEGYGTLGFTRLAINGLTELGMQPMKQEDRSWVCNGEIYNAADLVATYNLLEENGSDCGVIGPLYERFCHEGVSLEGFFQALDGVFSVVLVDEGRQQIIIARDPYGVRPLYKGKCVATGRPVYASEIKGLLQLCEEVEPFPPGHYQVIQMNGDLYTVNEPKAYHGIPWIKQLRSLDMCKEAVRTALEAAVKKRVVTTEREVACLLSGGLDSSLVAALVAKVSKELGRGPIRTYSIGMEGSQDLRHARMVAEYIGSTHTEVIVTAEEMFAAVPEVIRAIESYDTTTVRASVPNYLLAKTIRETSDCKVVFNGDGADEVWGSYLYFNLAPSDAAYEDECRRLLRDMHMFDVLRSDRSVAANGLEARSPYLDKQFVATVLSLPVEFRRPTPGGLCEKWLMRESFPRVLPSQVLWRRKEAFSDGVSGDKAWYQSTQEMAAAALPDWTSYGTKTAEQAYYKDCYVQAFGNSTLHTNVPYYWMPRWSPGVTDPSARTLPLY